jgi:uncharacterized protein (TIGR00730 family)
MRQPAYKPEKAYRNLEFLASPQARPLRILSEFLEPLQRFHREGIRDTIVVFGSARVKSREAAKKELETIRRSLRGHKRLRESDEQKLSTATNAVHMSRYYEECAELTGMLTRWSMRLGQNRRYVICSGGGPGIMEAANKGAYEAGGRSIGLNISLPFEQGSNQYITERLGFEFHYFFMRKFWFVYLAKAMVMFPGGFGTLDELMEVMTLVQTQKVKKPLPIVLYGRRYWNEVLNLGAMVKYGTISEADLALFRFADTPAEAFSYLKKELLATATRR